MTDAGLHDTMRRAGGVVDGSALEPSHFGDPAGELRAALETCALVARTSLGRLVGDGPDLLDLLHRLSTNAVKDLGAGDGAQTVLTSPKGRIVERLFVHHLGDAGVLLLGGPDSATRVLEHLARYTFAERTGLRDATAELEAMSLVGPRATAVAGECGLELPGRGGTSAAALDGCDVRLLGHDALGADGVTVVAPAASAGAVWQALATETRRAGGRPAGWDASEARRVLLGVPRSPTELNEEHNPLEAGLWQAVSFDKGCYVGQEVVARLDTYDKVARTLFGFALPPDSRLPAAGTALRAAGAEVGSVTTAVVDPRDGSAIGLCYAKHRRVEAGSTVEIGDAGATTRLTELAAQTQPVRRKK